MCWQRLTASFKWLGYAVAVSVLTGCTTGNPSVEGTQGFRDEIHRPPEPYSGPPRSGEQVYAFRCGSCHGRATQGAPIPGDNLEWERRAQKGMAVLMQHVKQGYNRGLMPRRGGCGNCSDSELQAAVFYMLEKSGIRSEAVPP